MLVSRNKLIRIVAILFFLRIAGLSAADPIQTIEELNFVIEGNTQENALRRFVDLQKGDSFSSEAAFFELLEQEKQDLVNYRVYDSVDYSAEIIREETGTVFWRVTYTVVDSWTLIPIPYPKYSTNSGFRLAVRVDYANAFGSMTNINLNMGINLKYNDIKDTVEVTQWNFTPEWSGVRVNDWLWLTFIADMSLREAEFDSGDTLTQYHYSYYRTGLGTSFNFNLAGNWFYRATPYFDFRYGYEDKNGWGNYSEQPFNIALNHGGGWGKVNWQENFRAGQAYDITHTIRYIYDTDASNRKFVNEIDANSRWYVPIGGILNYYSRIGAFYVFNDVRSGAGDYIRGVNNSSMSGETGVYINNSLGFQFWRWTGVWDAQIHPFLDIGLIGTPGRIDIDRDLQYGAGVDLVLFVDKLPSLVARATIGFNLSDRSLTSWDKLELIITSALTY